jgi:hypothetical protein
MSTKATKKAPSTPWVSSRANELLRTDIIAGDVMILMDPFDVYGMRDEFREYPFDKFRTNLKKLHAAVDKERDRAGLDSDAHAHDLLLHPPLLQGPSGYPQWQGSKAARLLKLDVLEGKSKAMKPSALRDTRKEYQAFPLKVFRKHIEAEDRSRKDSLYWLLKKNKKKDQDDAIILG